MSEELNRVEVNGVELHYLERGRGAPVLFIHGGLQDYRYWLDYVDELSGEYRVVAYSRRYNHPNDNPELKPDYSPRIDAEDLAALRDALGLETAWIVAHSYGAFAALLHALDQPASVRGMALGEPPLHRLALDTEEGRLAFQDLMQRAWMPAAVELRDGDREEGVRRVAEYFLEERTLDDLSDRGRSVLLANARELEAQARSLDPFPEVSRERLSELEVPVLLLSGEETIPAHRQVDDRLEQLLPRLERRVLSDAGHSVWRDRPEEGFRAVRDLLART